MRRRSSIQNEEAANTDDQDENLVKTTSDRFYDNGEGANVKEDTLENQGGI
jgi:hypothetical protein